MRGYSSVGRALPLQGRCQRFKSAYLHQFHMSPLFFLLFFVRDVFCCCFQPFLVLFSKELEKVGVLLNVKPPSVFGNGLCKMRNFQVDGNRTVEGAFPKTIKHFVFPVVSSKQQQSEAFKVKSVHSGIKSFIFSTSFSAWLKILLVRVDSKNFVFGYDSLRRSNSIMLMVDT
jgi:hypothetical protein